VGLLFFLSGRSKLFAPERREQMRQTLVEAHIPFPDFNALFVSTVEFVCGLLLVLGALTPLVCALLAFVMIVAVATIAIRNIKASSPTEWLAAFLYLPEPLYLVILIWLFFAGPGWLSVDHLLLSQIRL
jgi:putative oxidoreductase